MNTLTKILVIAAWALYLSACGGGGGNKGGSTTNPTTSPTPSPAPTITPTAAPTATPIPTPTNEPNPGEPTLIDGDEGANAKTETVSEFKLTPVPEEEIERSVGLPFARSQLKFFFSETATVKEVNDLLTKYDASIEASIGGTRMLLVNIPDPGSLEAFETLKAVFAEESIVTDVFPVSKAGLPRVLPSIFDLEDPDHFTDLDHHLSLGFHAAWNAQQAAGRPSVVVSDYFGSGFIDINVVNGINVDADNYALTTLDDHGYHVLGILGHNHQNWIGGALPVAFTLDVVDLQGAPDASGYDMMTVNRAANLAGIGTVVVSMSLGDGCTFPDTGLERMCEADDIREQTIDWIKSIREAGIENSVLFVVAAGNIFPSDPWAIKTQTDGRYSYASVVGDLVDDKGVPVPPLTNTIAVENANQLPNEEAGCVSSGSVQFDGAVTGIGSEVYSLIDNDGNYGNVSGTSMATPQVAGLAAYISAIRPNYTPQQIMQVIYGNTRPTEYISDGPLCTETKVANLIQAYESILALDDGVVAHNSASSTQATPVRFALMDVTNAARNGEADNRFDRHDLADFFDVFTSAEEENPNGIRNYSRFDLNGDRYLGGEELREPFDLNANGVIGDVVNAGDGTVNYQFNENNVNDWEIFCYYAFSELYQDSAESLENYHDDFNKLCGTLGEGRIYYQAGSQSAKVHYYDFETEQNIRVSSNETSYARHPKKFLNGEKFFYTGRKQIGLDLLTGIYYQDGRGSTPYLIAGEAWEFSVSEGNNKIVYEIADTLFISNLDGTDVTQLTSDNEVSDYPALSPDGKWLAYAKFNDVGDASQLSLVNLDTGATTHGLSLNASGAVYNPAWSWDSQFVAYELEDSVQILDVANGTITTLNTETSYRAAPSWSPAGDKIAFAYMGDIYTVKLDGSERTLVIANPELNDQHPFWTNE